MRAKSGGGGWQFQEQGGRESIAGQFALRVCRVHRIEREGYLTYSLFFGFGRYSFSNFLLFFLSLLPFTLGVSSALVFLLIFLSLHFGRKS